MKSIVKTGYFAAILFLFCLNGNAQIYDVFTGTSVETANLLRKIEPKIKFVKGEIDFSCLHIQNDETAIIKTVNEKILELFTSYFESEVNFLPVYRKMEKRIEEFNKMFNSKNSNNYRDNSADNMACRLNDAECVEVSLVSNLLFFRVNFDFWLNTGYNEGIEFTVSDFYYIDLLTAKITALEFEWNEAQKERIMASFKDILNTEHALLVSNLDEDYFEDFFTDEDDDYDDDEDVDSKNKKDKLPGSFRLKDVSGYINLNEAKVYWLGWGLMFEFQKYSSSSSIYFGNPFKLFIPLDKAKKMMEGIPEFTFIKNLKSPVNNQKNMNFYTVSQKANDIHYPSDIKDWVLNYEGKNKPKAVNIKYYQVLEDATKTNETKRKFEFDKKGNITEEFSFDKEGKKYLYTEYKYNDVGNILAKRKIDKDGNVIDSDKYIYDENGNLIEIIYSGGGDLRVVRYFYSGFYIYQMDWQYFDENRENEIHQNYYDGNEIRWGDLSHFLNDSGKITKVISGKYTYRQFQVGRDEAGRILEVHRENDRYNRFYQYDSLGRIESIKDFENSRTYGIENYFYEGTFDMPQKIEFNKLSGGNNTYQVQEYSWEF
jgi:hypothetical protein